ncbi:MAG TPA: DUF3501 family protein [Nitrospira sp.]|nr:DUF3501 family protein [Nitrospira sp.]MBS0173322.1 DUF3501 family protein [Nitrospira sp.]MCW5779367.1 DUF3501 family protein [Nitrospira sp.]HMZ54615.1 DUF3501 family protein [Nitrospira sp.]HNA27009.1 DUF3501 family protein [Nitrospira sp.]
MMPPLTQADVLSPDEYERQRESYRRRIIELKRRRRISLGDKITLVFENRETLRFQVQEMIRVERILDPQKIQDELDVYNALLPADGELSATLLIELTEANTMKEWLDRFMGLDHGEKLGLRAGGELVYGEFEGGHSHETKISAVHFVRFRPTPAMVSALSDQAVRVALSVHHSGYDAEVDVPWTMREEWVADLRPRA